MFAAAATNQMTTNATVAVIIDEVFELARSFATPRHAAHSTKPTAMMIAVRMATSRRFLLVSEMVAETYAKHHRAGGDDSPLEIGPTVGSTACDCSTTSRKPFRKDATPTREFNRMKQMCEYAGNDTMELYLFLLFR
jgi:hypothetical protein